MRKQSAQTGLLDLCQQLCSLLLTAHKAAMGTISLSLPSRNPREEKGPAQVCYIGSELAHPALPGGLGRSTVMQSSLFI